MTIRSLIGVASALLLVTACSGVDVQSNEPQPSDGTGDATDATRRAQIVQDQGGIGGLPVTQRSLVMDDLTVTESAYHEATFRAIDCMLANGVRGVRLEFSPELQKYRVWFEQADTAVADRCTVEHAQTVHRLWLLQKEIEQRPANSVRVAQAVQCMADHGVLVRADAPIAEVAAAAQAEGLFEECVVAHVFSHITYSDVALDRRH